VRAELDWAVAPQSLPKSAARVLVNLASLAAGVLPLGGVARAELSEANGAYLIAIRAQGPRARLQAELEDGLAGRPLGEGLGGRWVQAYYAYAIAKAAGGRISAEAGEDLVTLSAVVAA